MYVHSVKLMNYKSIGEYAESEVILEPKVTAIIGKNESGKSNVLEGLSQIDFRKRNNMAFSNEVINRNLANDAEIRYLITLKSENDDKVNQIFDDTEIVISKDACNVTGGLLKYYTKDIGESIISFFDELEKNGDNPFRLSNQEKLDYNNNKSLLSKTDLLDLYKVKTGLNFIGARIKNISNEDSQELISRYNAIMTKWNEFMGFFPVFYYRKSDRHLATRYKIEEVEKQLKNPASYPTSLLYNVVKLLGISVEDFVLASKAGSGAQQESVRSKIKRKIDEKINVGFESFYCTEKIYLEPSFNSGVVSFIVRSNDGEALMLSERSNGLKWYLETYIDLLANDMVGKNVIYLLDEPGISLHVNAQKELIKLFKKLAENENQVVYTTHSPYMLDVAGEGIHRVRAVVKDRDGFTRVYKTAYDSRIAKESKRETLTPIISAIGMSLTDSFGPAMDKMNVVVEGMSDYIFLMTMAKLLGIDLDKYAFIPSVGVTNSINICSILCGWKCPYVAVFDYDKEGVQKGGNVLTEKMGLNYGKEYIYYKEITSEELVEKTYLTDSYKIEDLFTINEIQRFRSIFKISSDIEKALLAKIISNKIENGEFIVSDTCSSNFKRFFERIHLLEI